MSGCWPRAVTIESSLKGGCALIHKRVGGDCKGTCVKFGVTEDMVESNASIH